jgi:hypothetical protein
VYTFKSSAIRRDKFLPFIYFEQNSTVFLSPGTRDQIAPESNKPSRPAVLQSTSDLNEAGPSTATQERSEAGKTMF